MKLFNNKKGIIFTLLAILLSTMFILIMTGGTINRLDSNLELQTFRADMLNSYYDSFVDYSNYVIRLSARSCIKSITYYMVNNGKYYGTRDDFFGDLQYCMNYSNITTLTGSEVHLVDSENMTIDKLFDYFINLTSLEYDVETEYNIRDIEIKFESASGKEFIDEISISTNIKINISNENTLLSLPIYDSFVYVSLKNAYDPFYSNEYEDIKQINNITVIGKNDDDLRGLTFNQFLERVDYVQYSNGTSILNRIINDTTISDKGVISFIDRAENLGDSYSYVDLFYINRDTFECYELYCEKNVSGGNCVDNFSIDSITFAVMSVPERYNLDISGWEKECPEPAS